MGGYQLPEWIRISVGTPEENSRCFFALQKVLAPAPTPASEAKSCPK
jgi:histidinol-phosphate aminotransferase